MKFRYRAQNEGGEMMAGILEATDRFSLARELREKGYLPISVEEVKKNFFSLAKYLRTATLFSSVKIYEKVIFAKSLSGMIQAGLSLFRALGIIEKQVRNKKFKQIIGVLMEGINKGETLSGGLGKFPRVFSGLFAAMVRAGEESGNLSESLRGVVLHLENTYKLNRKIRGAFTYPVIVVAAMVLIGVAMFIFVVPTLTQTFKELGVELPWTTKIIISLSDALINQSLLILFVFLIIVSALVFLFRSKFLKPYFDFLLLYFPVLGNLIREVNAARTARTLSSLLSAGVDITKSISITREVLQNSYYKKILTEAEAVIKKGLPLSQSFKESKGLYPVMVGEMIGVGEETGNLAKMLSDIALFYEEEVDNKTKNLSTIIEPILMILIGAAVGFFAVSMLTPIYSVLQNL